jgi:hypothetical protein
METEKKFDLKDLDLNKLYKQFRKREQQCLEGFKNGFLFFDSSEDLIKRAQKLAWFDVTGLGR